MSRSRVLKPGFFKNEELAALPYEARLLFAGLWTLADREGRLEDRPKRIKAELFPYDNLDIDAQLTHLATAGFIARYTVESKTYIAIPKFKLHQHLHIKEQASVIPAPSLNGTSTVLASGMHGAKTPCSFSYSSSTSEDLASSKNELVRETAPPPSRTDYVRQGMAASMRRPYQPRTVKPRL